ncbi:MAG: heme ABC exporter ATP-binding protein CcmA [Dehalococcoidales bacterium]
MAKAGSVSQDYAIEIRELTKSFGHNRILRGINLEIKQGESIVIFGPNGAGKTTLIKVLATIITLSSGKVVIDGLDIKDRAEEVRRRIGVVTHQTFLYQNLTAYENLEFYSRIYDVPELKKRINEVMEMVGMISRLHQRVGTLSRGMQQRVTIARSLLHNPAIMLLDEPETGLDQQATSMLWDAMQTDGQKKRTLIFTTHNLERGFEVGERLLILDKGRIVYEGSRQVLDLSALEKAYKSNTMVSA